MRRGAGAGTVLRHVLDNGPIARSSIARETGLSPASVTGHSAQLARLGLIRDSPEAARARTVGRPHVPVDLDGSGYVVGAVHVAVSHVTAALVDLRGRVLGQISRPHAGVDPASVVSAAGDGIARLLGSRDAGTTPVGIGVATGGRVDRDGGIVLEHPMLGWRDVPLRSLV
ncbi:MAG: sugar kinase, partial [Mycobacteriales bacterium]